MDDGQLAPIEHLISEWARWMREPDNRLGYPRRVPMMASGGGSETFDDLCERADRVRARAMDACIRSLPAGPCAAVHSVWLGSRWVLDWLDRDECYAEAVARLPRVCAVRGVL